MEAKSINLCYLNRAGRFALRPERSGSEIGLPDAPRMRTAGVAEFATVTATPESCVSILSDTFLESLEIVALRLCGRLVRRLFLGLGDSTTSIALFLDFATAFSDFLACVRCARVSAARSLHCAVSAAFCAR
jgi:hypothetical protein